MNSTPLNHQAEAHSPRTEAPLSSCGLESAIQGTTVLFHQAAQPGPDAEIQVNPWLEEFWVVRCEVQEPYSFRPEVVLTSPGGLDANEEAICLTTTDSCHR